MSGAIWGQARVLAEQFELRPGHERSELLSLIAHLPFIGERSLRLLFGHRGPGSIDRRLRFLLESDLVATVSLATSDGRPARLFHLTDLGLATLAYGRHRDVSQLARRYGIDRAGLHALIPRLPIVEATYDLIGALTFALGTDGTRARLERPWRRRFGTLTSKAPVAVELPVRVAFPSTGGTLDCLLLPDLGTFVPHHHRHMLRKLMWFRRLSGSLPLLVISTGDECTGASWLRVMDDLAHEQGDLPLSAIVLDPSDTGDIRQRAAAFVTREASPIPGRRWKAMRRIANDEAVPEVVGNPLLKETDSVRSDLTLTPEDRAVIDVIGRYPLLLQKDVCVLRECSREEAQRRCERLIRLEFVRKGPPPRDPKETGEEDKYQQAIQAPHVEKAYVLQLTKNGFKAGAGKSALPIEVVRRKLHGADGTTQQKKREGRLFAQFDHTRGVVRFFTGLIEQAAFHRTLGEDDALLDWQSEAFCSRRGLWPDGYGVYKRHGHRFGFFLEYDRATERRDEYERKFTAYYEYRDSGAYQRDYNGFPTILMVTSATNAAERLIADAARSAGMGHPALLPLLLTTSWQLRNSRNPDGPLGKIWRTAASPERRYWQRGAGGGTRSGKEVTR